MVQIIKRSERSSSGLDFETLPLRDASQGKRNERVRTMTNGLNGFVFLARMLIRSYQLLIRPILPRECCRFYPSCSDYALTAITQYGLLKGGWQSLRRLARCHPWSLGGYDPVIINKEKN